VKERRSTAPSCLSPFPVILTLASDGRHFERRAVYYRGRVMNETDEMLFVISIDENWCSLFYSSTYRMNANGMQRAIVERRE